MLAGNHPPRRRSGPLRKYSMSQGQTGPAKPTMMAAPERQTLSILLAIKAPSQALSKHSPGSLEGAVERTAL